MSSSLTQIGIELTRIAYPIMIVFGVLGNLMNIATFTQPVLRHHACSRYLLALAINGLLYSSFFFIQNLLQDAYHIYPSNSSVFACKTLGYIGALIAFLSPYFIVCASIDRYCASSTRALLRRFSNIKIAQRVICVIIVFFALLLIHVLVLTNIVPEKGYFCVIQAVSIYSQVYIIIHVSIYTIVPPCLMTLFGLLTIKNTNGTRVIRAVASRYNRTERQLAQMLFLQIAVQILLTLPVSVTYTISVFPNTIGTTSTFIFLNLIFSTLLDCSYVVSLLLYLLSGRVYRKELKRLFQRLLQHLCSNQVRPLQRANIAMSTTLSIQPRFTIQYR